MIRFIQLVPGYIKAKPELINLASIESLRPDERGKVVVRLTDGSEYTYRETFDNVVWNLKGLIIGIVPK